MVWYYLGQQCYMTADQSNILTVQVMGRDNLISDIAKAGAEFIWQIESKILSDLHHHLNVSVAKSACLLIDWYTLLAARLNESPFL